jgi:hypothetical protein
MTARGGDLRGEPTAEGEAEQGDFRLRQGFEKVEIEVHEVVHRVETLRARRIAEAGMRGGDDLGAAAQQIQEARGRIDRLHAMQGQDGLAGAAAHDLQCDVTNLEPVR